MQDAERDGDVAGVQAEVAADHPAVLHQLRQDVLGHVDRDGEADALGRLDDGRVDADDPAAAVHERAAAVAGVQGRVGLDDVVDQVAGDAAQRPAQGADDAGGDGATRSRAGCRWRRRAGRRAASPSRRRRRSGTPSASAWTTARSVHGSVPTTRPASSWPSPRRTRTRPPLPWTTWWLVSRKPSGVNRTPEPWPCGRRGRRGG